MIDMYMLSYLVSSGKKMYFYREVKLCKICLFSFIMENIIYEIVFSYINI